MYFKLDSNVPSGGSQYEHLYAYIGCIGRVQRHFFSFGLMFIFICN